MFLVFEIHFFVMKLKEIKTNISKNFDDVVFEYSNPDGARIDALVSGVLAVEFEKSYKWINQRVLYNVVKAKRAGLKKLVIVYPFNPKSIESSWVNKFSQEQGIKLILADRENYLGVIKKELY